MEFSRIGGESRVHLRIDVDRSASLDHSAWTRRVEVVCRSCVRCHGLAAAGWHGANPADGRVHGFGRLPGESRGLAALDAGGCKAETAGRTGDSDPVAYPPALITRLARQLREVLLVLGRLRAVLGQVDGDLLVRSDCNIACPDVDPILSHIHVIGPWRHEQVSVPPPIVVRRTYMPDKIGGSLAVQQDRRMAVSPLELDLAVGAVHSSASGLEVTFRSVVLPESMLTSC